MLQDRTEKVPNVPSEFLEKMSFSQPFPLFQSPHQLTCLLLLLLLLLLPKSTSRHQNSRCCCCRCCCSEKVPNVPSEFLEKCLFLNLFHFFNLPPAHLLLLLPKSTSRHQTAVAAAAANRRVARAPPGTKTARHGRTNMPQNRTEKVPNVPSEFLEKNVFLFPNLFPLFQSHQPTCCCCC